MFHVIEYTRYLQAESAQVQKWPQHLSPYNLTTVLIFALAQQPINHWTVSTVGNIQWSVHHCLIGLTRMKINPPKATARSTPFTTLALAHLSRAKFAMRTAMNPAQNLNIMKQMQII